MVHDSRFPAIAWPAAVGIAQRQMRLSGPGPKNYGPRQLVTKRSSTTPMARSPICTPSTTAAPFSGLASTAQGEAGLGWGDQPRAVFRRGLRGVPAQRPRVGGLKAEGAPE